MSFADLWQRRGIAFWIGMSIIAAIVGVAVLGPLVAPHSPTATIGPPGSPPIHGALLGTDTAGRDVLSRVLYGGRSVLGLGVAATVLAYVIGLAIGLTASYRGGRIDAVLMRAVEIPLIFPPLLMILLALVALGSSPLVLIAVVGFWHIPRVSRVVRAAGLDIRVRPYVEAAVLRGESRLAVVRRDVLPNIAGVVFADFGLRFAYSIIFLATVNFLGFGLAPPASDWGLMIAENQQAVTVNAWAVFAPAAMLALIAVGVGLVSDSMARSIGTRAASAE